MMRNTSLLVRTTAILLSIFWLSTSHAAIIDYGDYTQVDDLDWLDLSLTDGQTVQDALANNSGWTIATKTQYQTMLQEFEVFGDGQFMLGAEAEGGVETAYSNGLYSYNKAESSYADNSFFDLFGLTYSEEFGNSFRHRSNGWYDEGGIQRLGGIYVTDHKLSDFNDTAWVYGEFDSTYSTMGSFGAFDSVTGTFLVRASAVPTPATLGLLLLGLLMILRTGQDQVPGPIP